MWQASVQCNGRRLTAIDLHDAPLKRPIVRQNHEELRRQLEARLDPTHSHATEVLVKALQLGLLLLREEAKDLGLRPVRGPNFSTVLLRCVQSASTALLQAGF